MLTLFSGTGGDCGCDGGFCWSNCFGFGELMHSFCAVAGKCLGTRAGEWCYTEKSNDDWAKCSGDSDCTYDLSCGGACSL